MDAVETSLASEGVAVQPNSVVLVQPPVVEEKEVVVGGPTATPAADAQGGEEDEERNLLLPFGMTVAAVVWASVAVAAVSIVVIVGVTVRHRLLAKRRQGEER